MREKKTEKREGKTIREYSPNEFNDDRNKRQGKEDKLEITPLSEQSEKPARKTT